MSQPLASTASSSGTSISPLERTGRHANGTALLLFLGMGGLAYAALQSLVAPALGDIGTSLHVSAADVSWVVTAYLLSASVLTPILGRLGDMIGKRRVLIIVLVVLGLGTALAGVSTTLTILIVARSLQGAAGAILPLSIGIVRDELPREKVGVAVGLLSAVFGIGAGLGIVAAGPIVEHLSWQWLFWFPLVLVIAALIGVLVGVPESPVRSPGRLDLVGALILSVSLVALLMAISMGHDWGWGSTKTVGLLVLGVVAMVVFVLVELRVRSPLINMRLVAIRGVWTTNVVGLFFGFVMFGMFLLIPTLLEMPTSSGYGFGRSISEAGLFMLPTTMLMLVFGPVSGLLERRYGPKLPLFLGSVSVALAFLLPALWHGASWMLLVSGTFTGIGIGLVFAAMPNAIIECVPATHTGEATSVNSIVRTIGGSVGAAVIAAVLASGVTSSGLPSNAAFTLGFWVCTAAALVAVGASMLLPSAKRRHEEAVAAGVEDLPPEPEELHVHVPHLRHDQ